MIEIKHRFSGAVLFKSESATTVREAVIEAVKAGAYLAGADLAGADLAGADLAGADLAGAYLADADLADADLAGAYLAGANLAGANLADANLAGAYLADADLAHAYLAGANLAGANLAGAYLAGADLAHAYLAGANLAGANLAGAYLAGADLAHAYLARAHLADALNIPTGTTAMSPAEPYKPARSAADFKERAQRYREAHPQIPVVEALDKKILDVITSGGGALDMGGWHSCETTHCRAGWAIHLAGEAGYALERQHGPERAGAMIYRASTGRVPHFYAPNGRALEDIKARAAEQSE